MNIKQAKQYIKNSVNLYLKKDEDLRPFDVKAYLETR